MHHPKTSGFLNRPITTFEESRQQTDEPRFGFGVFSVLFWIPGPESRGSVGRPKHQIGSLG